MRPSRTARVDPNRSFKFADANVGFRIAKRSFDIDVKADGTFNLSEEEMKALSKALSGVKAGDSSAADKTSRDGDRKTWERVYQLPN